MKTVEEIANVIVVRNHLAALLNGTRNAVQKKDIQTISAMITKLDTDIIHATMQVFAEHAKPSEDEDVAKRVAEAKAKLAAQKAGSVAATPAKAEPKKVVKKVVKRAAEENEAVDSNDQ